MNKFEKLEDLVEDNKLRIINVVAVPRSVSTALGRALNEVEDPCIFINEPFNRNNGSLEVAASGILETIRPICEQIDGTVTVITKNMAAYLSSEVYQELSHIADGVVWSIRNPLVQIGSLVSRLANDIAVETGADALANDAVDSRLDEVTQFLLDSELSQNFSRTGWEAISGHFHNQIQPERSVVVDGQQLTMDPIRVLQGVTKAIGLIYNDRMVNDWSSHYVNLNVGVSRFAT